MSTVASTIRLRSDTAVGLWLMAVAGLIVVMLAVGGLTRLTGSGLSITEWDPIVGAVPPLSHADWQAAFAKYREIPQYRLVHAGMTLDAFKGIFWWEWAHRFLGRAIGFGFLGPFVWFAATGAIGKQDWGRMLLLFALGGLQGFVGWWMVESGLEVRVAVSQYRLAIHLGVAVLLLGAIFWVGLEYLRGRREVRADKATMLAAGFTALVFFQMMLGALVAGLHAGLHYNDWPLMNGALFPQAPFQQGAISFFENGGLAQFDHRVVGYVVAGYAWVFWSWLRTRNRDPLPPAARRASTVVLAVMGLQVYLGIETLLYQVPVWLAALHQVVAALLFCAALWLVFELSSPASARSR